MFNRLFKWIAGRPADRDTPAVARTPARPRARIPGRTPGRPRSPAPQLPEPRILSAESLGLSRQQVSSAALRTCEELQHAGYSAYIVGGGVRDLLLGRAPKDFDVATDASPEAVQSLFRRARIIGRRFRIVHVMFGRETI